MRLSGSAILSIGILLTLLTYNVESQLLDQLFGNIYRRSPNEAPSTENQNDSPIGVRNTHGVSIPGIYDMVKQGNNLGLNVLSGLVKVERGAEAERSGLVGSRPLSVRIFGIPVYERGTRIRDPDSVSTGPLPPRPNVENPLDIPGPGEGTDEP